MTLPGFVPRPNTTIVDRLAAIEQRLRVMQQATAGATTANAGVPLGTTPGSPVAGSASAGALSTSARSDHVHTSTLAVQGDVTVSTPSAGQSLVYSGAAWANATVPAVVSALSAITSPYVGQLAYCTTDALLYKYTAGTWVAVAALGPDSPGSPSPAQVHEARYRAVTSSTAQALSSGNTAVQFGTVDYSSSDVVASGTSNSVFTLVRGGLWTIDINVRIGDTSSGVTRFVQLTDSTFATMYQAESVPVSGTPTVDIAIVCTMRFPVSTALSVNAVSSSTGTIDRATAGNAARTSISLAWLRP